MLRELPHGGGIMAVVLVATFAGDTGAYFAGRAFGTRPLAPTISPKKTVEGLAGGFLASILRGEDRALYQGWLSGWQAVVLRRAAGVAGPPGGPFRSLVNALGTAACVAVLSA